MGQDVSQQLIEQQKSRQQHIENNNMNVNTTDEVKETENFKFNYSQPKDVKETNS